MFNKKIDYVELNKMVKEITSGNLGLTNTKSGLFENIKTCIYEKDSTKLFYESKWSIGSVYKETKDTLLSYDIKIFYNNKLVYQCSSETKKRYNDYGLNDNLINEIYIIYNQNKKQEYIEKPNYAKIEKIFELLYLNKEYNGKYCDDKIIIDNIEHFVDSVEDWSSSDDSHYYKGRIRFLDGTIVYDSKHNICHPGLWIDYVYNLIDKLEEDKKIKQELIKREYELNKKIEEEKKQKIYRLNHTTIDDRKYFI